MESGRQSFSGRRLSILKINPTALMSSARNLVSFAVSSFRVQYSGMSNIGFLWSQGVRADTGFGKTTLMQEITKEINRNLGTETLTNAGVRQEKQKPVAAAYSNLNNLNASGLYPVLFNAVIALTRPSEEGIDAVFDQAKARIVEDLGTDDPSKITSHLHDTWLRICGTGAPLRYLNWWICLCFRRCKAGSWRC